MKKFFYIKFVFLEGIVQNLSNVIIKRELFRNKREKGLFLFDLCIRL